MHFILWSLWLLFQLFFMKDNEAIPLFEDEEHEDSHLDPMIEEYMRGRNNSDRGLLDILENFRQWQVERRKENPLPTKPPTPEPQGLEAFLPQLPPINQETFNQVLTNIRDGAADLAKAFVGPPPTTEPPFDVDENGTNISTTIPPNTLFCFLC